MATPLVKATDSLDPETVRKLEEMARRWRVSKSEALRRAIRSAAQDVPDSAIPAIRALDELQRSLALSPAKVRRWNVAARSQRTSASARRERRGR